MPTPFMHLHIAEQIRASAAKNGHGRLAAQLEAEWPAFYLGSVAPDVNAISEIARADTHFYDLPPLPENSAYEEMLALYPQIALPQEMAAGQALFVAAYIAHLMLDLIWLRQIVVPYFFEADHMGSRRQRRLTHFILLTYLDTLSLAALPPTAVTTLAKAQPDHWLPFASDEILSEWRDMLVAQLQPGAPIRTIEIYSERLEMSPEAFAQAIHDEAWMETHVFKKLPVADIQAVLQTAVPLSVQLISDYLNLTNE